MKHLLPLFLFPAFLLANVDLKSRATDYIQAFELLRKEKSAAKVYFRTLEGTSLTNIIEMTPMGNGTLILFKSNSPQGIKFQVIKVEDLLSLDYE